MNNEGISAEISQEQMDLFKQNLKAIDDLISTFAVNLSADQLKKMVKIGDKTIPFVDKSLEFAEARPELRPSYLDMDEFRRDWALASDLRTLLKLIDSLREKISDTSYVVSAEAFNAASAFYNSVKQASKAKVPGSDSVAAELGKRYKYSPSTQNNSNESSKKSAQKLTT